MNGKINIKYRRDALMTCQRLGRALKLAETEGNTILKLSKSELMDEVIWMNYKLSSRLRNKILTELKGLLYYKTDAKPHDPTSESFICNKCKIVLVFPL